MKKIQYIIVLLFISTTVFGQNMVDALRLSDYRLQGTARATAMGNAFGALGGDFTSASINPAGIGLYRSSEFVVTPMFGKTDVDGSYLGRTMTESKYNISIPNLGYVANFNSNPNNTSGLVSVSFGIGYNRLNNYNVEKLVEGHNATSSLLDLFTLNADGYAPSQLDAFYEQLAAYDNVTGIGTDLIYSDENNVYAHDMQRYPYTDDFTNYEHNQRKTFSQRGSIDEFVLSLAANFNHKFYLGATVGIHDVYFKENTSLYEYNINYAGAQLDTYLNDYSFNTYLRTTGTGFNLKLGAIFKPIDALRLGVAFHSPTFYDLHDAYDNSMESYITYADGAEYYQAYSPYGDYDYKLETPMKAIFSAAYVIGKAGLISVDYEYVDYSTMKLRDGGGSYNFFDENQDMEEAYKAVGNLHVGAEYRVTNNFSLRGGYEHYPSVFNKNAFGSYQPNSDASTSTYSAGFGWKMNGFFVDMAYKHSSNDNNLNLYDVPASVASPLAKFETMKDYITLTFGFRF
ncbi:MAG: OmpP1/FadL family transporter [Mangrovibacterium sp.]